MYEPLTMQKIFDMAASYMLRQNKKSRFYAGANCAYFGENGLRCPVGHFLHTSDVYEFYKGDSLSMIYDNIALTYKFDMSLPIDDTEPVHNLLGMLQNCHDIDEPLYWSDTLIKVAKEFDLDDSIVYKIIKELSHDD